MPLDLEHVLMLLIGGAGGGALWKAIESWRLGRGQVRDDRRDDFQALTAELRAEMARLRKEREETAKEFAEYRGRTEVRMEQLEREIELLRGRACPWGRVDCPRALAPVGVGSGI